MSASNDGSESVDQFLARIASIKEGKSEPNSASRLDEEFLKGRQERQARRLERARSISPSKTGPARPLSLSTNTFDSAPSLEQALNPPVDFSPQSKPLSRANAVSGRTSPVREFEDVQSRPVSISSRTDDAQPTASGLARSGTLSWQQRPAKRDGARQRPLSGVATVRSMSKEPDETNEKTELTRTEIAASLSSKDPTWFRQTQDRATGSAAFRKNQVEEVSEPLPSRSMQLPGMTRSREPSKSPVPETREESSPTRQKSPIIRDSPRFARGTTPDIVALRESMTEKPLGLRPSSQDTFSSRPTSSDTLAFDESTTSLARTSSTLTHNRPPSPTKGLGGFVESAMMKRSDSVSKRWSVKSNTGLVRGDSVAGARPRALHNRGLSKDVPVMRSDSPSSPLASSRPGSGHGQPSNFSPQMSVKQERPREDVSPSREAIEPDAQPSVATVSRPQTPTEDALLARSPSKTMDPRRWSPTKSTWLETALQQQTEPPKMQPMKEEQPKWKVDLQRSKSRASRDVSPDKAPAGAQQVVASSKPDKRLPLRDTPALGRQNQVPEAHNTEPPAPRELSSRINLEPSNLSKTTTAPELATKTVTEQTSEPLQKIVQKDVPAPLKQAPVLKPKPQTPPKTDFRGTLKSRTTGPTQNADSEPEFKAVFGKLKRATTQNYVAPDELKTNILTGKAALNTTGGPVKTKRVDEFKESILAKKEEMKTAGPKPVLTTELKTKAEEPLPEALARRKTLSKASAPDLSSLKKKPETKPELPSKPTTVNIPDSAPAKANSATPTVAAKVETLKKPFAAKATEAIQNGKPSVKVVEDVKDLPSSSQADLETTTSMFKTKSLPTVLRPTQTQSTTQPQSPETTEEPNQFSVSTIPKSGAVNATPVAGKLASRLNPNLAAMLSRGPSPKPPSGSNEQTSNISKSAAEDNAPSYTPNDDAGLTHMTKARAKGPKRRAPKAEPAKKATPLVVEPSKVIGSGKSLSQEVKPVSTPPKPTREWKPKVVSPEVSRSPAPSALKELQQPKTPSKQTERAPVTLDKDTPKQDEQRSSLTTEKPKPAITSKSPDLARKVSGSPAVSNQLASDSKPATPPKPISAFVASKSKPDAERKEAIESRSDKVETTPVPSRETRIETLPKASIKPIATKPKPSIVQGLGVTMSPSPKAVKTPMQTRELTPPPDEEIKLEKSAQHRDLKPLLEGYLGSLPNEYERADFDAHQFLTRISQPSDKIKTLQHNIIEVSGDGKRSELASHQQHILYEEAMYLTTHKFSIENGNTTSEVQLWCGDRVSDAAVEDAQVFCRRTAREHNAKLEVVKQGKESSRFISGLGGILITRRSKSSALYMLCGRQHLGHIVFDEVDMTSKNLCPGFAYIVSAPYGKLFLWKGKGAGVDEVSSARLIGNDLGLTGEIDEIEQGQEPSLFWDAIGKSESTEYSKDWQNRASGIGRPTALYRIEHERPGMLTNLASWGLKRATSPAKQQTKATCEFIQPFTQNDLDHPSIHILDAYHTLYIIVTRQCASKAAEFITSMHLAQDFAMLSPAIQDRSVLPVCYVVAGDLPQDLKVCFRKWGNVEGSSLIGKGSLCVRLEEVMEEVDL